MDDRLLKLLVDLRHAIGDNGARMQGELVEYAKQIKAKADEADALREALVLTQSRPVPLSSVVVGRHGDGMYFSIGNQYFRLAYAPTEPAEFDFMRRMLLSAFSRLVESAPAPQAHAGPGASGADSGMPGSAAERHLRRLLCLRAGMALTYWDDGEAQGTEHGISIDFMREPVADIDAKLCALNVARAARPSSPEPDEPEGSVCARCGALAFDPVVAQQAEPDLRLANPIGLTPPQKEMQRRQLAQQAEPVQEPAFHGFMSDDGTQVDVCFSPSAPRRDGTYATAYYTAPPHRVAQQAEPVEEPAYKVKVAGRWHEAEPIAAAFNLPDGEHLLYTAPPQRRPLTEEEIESCRQQGYAHAGLGAPFDFGKAARAVEKASWEKNHGQA